MIRLSVSLVFLCLFSFVFAQNGWNWGQNKSEAQGKWFLLNQAIKSGNYQRARPEAVWLLANAPDLKEDLYIQAIKIYEGLEKNAEESEKLLLQDSVLKLYDVRLEKFGDSASVYNRKGLVMYKYLHNRINDIPDWYNFYQKTYQLNENATYISNLYTLLLLARREKNRNNWDDKQFLDLYTQITATIQIQKTEAEKSENAKLLESIHFYEKKIDELLLSAVELSCDFVESHFSEKFTKKKTLENAKMIYHFMLSQKCFDKELFHQSMAFILEKEPSMEGFQKQAQFFAEQNKHQEAILSYHKALPLAHTAQQIGAVQLNLAKLYAELGELEKARISAYHVLDQNHEIEKTYTLIGDLYFQSYDKCKTNHIVKDKLVYLAAYTMYAKANNLSKMKKAKAQFPSASELNLHNLQVGKTMQIECWINETVLLQKRD